MRFIILSLLFFCSYTSVSRLYSQDFFSITDFSKDEPARGEPVGWKTHKGICREKEVGGDDYPAAGCVVYGKTFLSIPYGYRILIYVYGNNLPAGERFKNPREARARMIVVQSGAQETGKWLSYKINHCQDYFREFGQELPGIIYVGIQTNADRTHGKVES